MQPKTVIRSPLSHCTFTGVDEWTDLQQLSRLSTEFPVVEWGFLYLPAKQGLPGRYPSAKFLQAALRQLPRNVRVALHVCGNGVLDLFGEEPVVTELFRLLRERGGRLQLNFNIQHGTVSLAHMKSFLDRHKNVPVITQHNENNALVWRPLLRNRNHAVLFDASLGRGISPEKWQRPLPDVHCGYAGNLGPNNLGRELPLIAAAAEHQPFWIDMESQLRDANDRLSVDSTTACLEIVDTFCRVQAKKRERFS